MKTLMVWLALVCSGWFVDRIEGSWAILVHEDGTFLEVPVADLPKGVREGGRVEWPK
jgi:predicted RNA binding protein YcfA (HicA-like mRNA interferase family)